MTKDGDTHFGRNDRRRVSEARVLSFRAEHAPFIVIPSGAERSRGILGRRIYSANKRFLHSLRSVEMTGDGAVSVEMTKDGAVSVEMTKPRSLSFRAKLVPFIVIPSAAKRSRGILGRRIYSANKRFLHSLRSVEMTGDGAVSVEMTKDGAVSVEMTKPRSLSFRAKLVPFIVIPSAAKRSRGILGRRIYSANKRFLHSLRSVEMTRDGDGLEMTVNGYTPPLEMTRGGGVDQPKRATGEPRQKAGSICCPAQAGLRQPTGLSLRFG